MINITDILSFSKKNKVMRYRLAYKLRFVQTFGRLKHNKKEWIFIAQPGKGCPILQMTDKSKWSLVENLYYYLNYQY